MQQPSKENKRIPPRIFIIDESAHITEYLRLALQSEGYEVIGCQQRSDAFNLIKEVQPHLIILDIVSLDEEGLMLYKQLRKEEAIHKCPIILVAEEIDTQVQQHELEPTTDTLVMKPFKYEDLVEQVYRFTGHLHTPSLQPKKGYMYRVDNPPPDLPPIIKRKSIVTSISSFFLRLIDFRRRRHAKSLNSQ